MNEKKNLIVRKIITIAIIILYSGLIIFLGSGLAKDYAGNLLGIIVNWSILGVPILIGEFICWKKFPNWRTFSMYPLSFWTPSWILAYFGEISLFSVISVMIYTSLFVSCLLFLEKRAKIPKPAVN